MTDHGQMTKIEDRLAIIEDLVRHIGQRVGEFPTEMGMRQAAAESIEYSLSELHEIVRRIELNDGREQIRQRHERQTVGS